jgi:hypothetical protein
MSICVEDIDLVARQAIAANWRSRNMRVHSDELRHSRMKAERRSQLWEWIAVCRIASMKENMGFIRARLRDSGPLMAHDLRNRVILAGFESVIERTSVQANG